jgi:hypothetical protein
LGKRVYILNAAPEKGEALLADPHLEIIQHKRVKEFSDASVYR